MARVVILGNGGHARALADTLDIFNIVFLENDDDVLPDDTVYIGVGDLETRIRLFERFRSQIPGRGVQFMANVHVGPNCAIGDNVLLNTGSQIDHDCIIGNHSIVSPGAILCGGVELGESCFIGAGSIIVEGVELENGTFVSAGSLVVKQNDIRRSLRLVSDRTMEGISFTPDR